MKKEQIKSILEKQLKLLAKASSEVYKAPLEEKDKSYNLRQLSGSMCDVAIALHNIFGL